MICIGGVHMPEIRPIKDLRNTNETSKLCHARNEPVYITKNGYGHLVVMSMETYKENSAKAELELNLNTALNLVHKCGTFVHPVRKYSPVNAKVIAQSLILYKLL